MRARWMALAIGVAAATTGAGCSLKPLFDCGDGGCYAEPSDAAEDLNGVGAVDLRAPDLAVPDLAVPDLSPADAGTPAG